MHDRGLTVFEETQPQNIHRRAASKSDRSLKFDLPVFELNKFVTDSVKEVPHVLGSMIKELSRLEACEPGLFVTNNDFKNVAKLYETFLQAQKHYPDYHLEDYNKLKKFFGQPFHGQALLVNLLMLFSSIAERNCFNGGFLEMSYRTSPYYVSEFTKCSWEINCGNVSSFRVIYHLLRHAPRKIKEIFKPLNTDQYFVDIDQMEYEEAPNEMDQHKCESHHNEEHEEESDEKDQHEADSHNEESHEKDQEEDDETYEKEENEDKSQDDHPHHKARRPSDKHTERSSHGKNHGHNTHSTSMRRSKSGLKSTKKD
ncbi:hypothetical protein HZS_6305 [Henneguya salminicola]|nr:hypothetical protein HZS_6305 [Henneguya salminicola]